MDSMLNALAAQFKKSSKKKFALQNLQIELTDV